ncbi:HD domain-containing protein [Exiguobacterium qingdaonense]|uniref:HD domain-containing protein n=1 Tax=Exiguobacterium qingdaonense TaxID=2751251 RepID=UPI001BE91FAD|nr:HD domain-containing protein [Exiguobacterium qingdaonense]
MNPLIEEALRFSATRHKGHTRNGSPMPCLSHSFAVAMLLESDHQPPSVVAAGLLHDLIDDSKAEPQEILTKFGPHVFRLVLAASEFNRSETWEEQKRNSLRRISTLQFDEVALLVADKLHELRSMRYDLEVDGMAMWQRFNRPMRDQSWYYHQLLVAFEPFSSSTDLIGLYEQELHLLFYGDKHVKDEKVTRLLDSILTRFVEDEWLQEAAPLCQTAYELREMVANNMIDEEIIHDRHLLDLAGSTDSLSPSVIAAIQELGYRTALDAEDLIKLLHRSIVN